MRNEETLKTTNMERNDVVFWLNIPISLDWRREFFTLADKMYTNSAILLKYGFAFVVYASTTSLSLHHFWYSATLIARLT